MTISTTVRKAGPFPGNGVTTVFPFAFKIFSKLDLVVTLTTIASGLESALVLDVDYTVAMNADQDATPGGTITYNPLGVPMTALQEVTLSSNVGMLQTLALTIGGGFSPSAISAALDRAIICIQQVYQLVTQGLRVSVSDTVPGVLPAKAARANNFLAFDANGDPIASGGAGSSPVSVAMAPVVSAATTAAAAAAMGVAALASPALTGNPTAPTPVPGDNDTSIATTAFVTALAGKTQVRQAVLAALLTTAGNNSALSAGAGLRVSLSAAAATPYVLSAAAGANGSGVVDSYEQFTANNADIIGANIAANNTSYLYRDLATAWGATLAPPQYGYAYDASKQSILQMGGANNSTVFLDDFGNTWTRQGGAKVTTSYSKFGTGSLGGGGATNAMDGATDFLKTTSITSLGSGGWSMRGWVKPLNALPGAGNKGIVFGLFNASAYGAEVAIFNNGGTIRFSMGNSSSGAGYDISSNVQGTTLPVLGTEYFVELTFDALAGVYRLYVNGAQEASSVSALKICGGASLTIGAYPTPSSYLQGYVTNFELLPYCDHPNGTAYAVPTVVPNIATAGYSSDFFSIPNMTMYSVTGASGVAGTNPTLAAKAGRLYVGEADTNGASVTAVRNYAIRGEFISPVVTPLPGAATTVSFNHNIGGEKYSAQLQMLCLTADNGIQPGAILTEMFGYPAGLFPLPMQIRRAKNSAAFTTIINTAPIAVIVPASGNYNVAAAASWGYQLIARRSF